MTEEETKRIEETINDTFKLRDKFNDMESNQRFQLYITQLDLLKTLSSISVAIIGILYLLNDSFEINKIFMYISLIFLLVILLGTISYTREKIDSESKALREVNEKVQEKTNDVINNILEIKTKDDFNLYREYINKEYQENEENKKNNNEKLVYTGEIFTFFFYCSIVSIMLSFFTVNNSNITILVFCFIGLIVAWFLSFKSWSNFLINFLSYEFKKREVIDPPKKI